MHLKRTLLPLLLVAALVGVAVAPVAAAATPADRAPSATAWHRLLDGLVAALGLGPASPTAVERTPAARNAAVHTGGTGDKGLGLDPDGTDPGTTGDGGTTDPTSDPSAPPPPG